MNKNILWTNQIFRYLNEELCDAIKKLSTGVLSNISEIRIHSSGEVSVTLRDKNIFLKKENSLDLKISKEQINEIFVKICNGTVYKFEKQICEGFITVDGGHRVGIAGTAVYENGKLVSVKDITALNFRISRQIKNASREIIGNIVCDNRINSAIIASEPCGGKTTILTDLVRLLSNMGKRCVVIDERGEICSMYLGCPQKDIGKLTCVLDGYSKGEGMMIALRSLSPQVLICDEVGSSEEVDAMLEALNAGVPVITTAHASNEDELVSRPQLERLIDSGAIDRLIFLKGSRSPGTVRKVVTINRYDEDSWNSDDID